MAAPLAYEPPTLQKSWDAFLQHIPVLLVVNVAGVLVTLTGLLVPVAMVAFLGDFGAASDATLSLASVVGNLLQIPLSILSSLIGVLMVAVPAMYYEFGKTVSLGVAFEELTARFWRYVLAGLFFSLITAIGLFFCILPGIAIVLVTPVYVNRIFVTNMSIGDAFSQSFQAVYRSENGISFLGLEILTGLLVAIASIVTCGLGALVAVPMGSFYLQNAAYRQGLLH